MKKILEYIVMYIVIAIVIYVFCAFINADLNVFALTKNNRLGLVFLWCIFSLIATVIKGLFEDF